MDTIVLADHIGEWLVPTSINPYKMIYKIVSEGGFEAHHSVNYAIKPYKIDYGRSYNNERRFYKLVSDEEAQAILNSRVKPHPNQKVINKIREMKSRRKKMGYVY